MEVLGSNFIFPQMFRVIAKLFSDIATEEVLQCIPSNILSKTCCQRCEVMKDFVPVMQYIF